MMRLVTALLTCAVHVSAAQAAGDPSFGSHWHDGKAEIDGYRLTLVRYGEKRTGEAALIYVTEPFSDSKHVKVDDPSKNPRDTFDAFKLNVVRRFQTGIYDYHTMLSLFVRSADFSPVKAAFTSAEWCGQVYDETNFANGRVTRRFASYFEGESGDTSDDVPRGAIVEDNLFILLRGLNGAFLRPGESRTAPFYQSPFYSRLTHDRTAWTRATIARAAKPETVRVPAGSFSADVYEVTLANGRSARFAVERAYPHRIVRWSWRDASTRARLGGSDTGELTGTTRSAYWTQQKLGDERALRALGLTPIPGK